MDHILTRLTAQGLAIFPVCTNKVPATPHGFRDAVKTVEEARQLFARYPNAPLIGIATGNISGVDVLDIDQKPQAREWWLENRQRIPQTRAHRTRSGGLHLVFRHAPGLRCSTSRITIGVDVKADAGCCTWWPASGYSVLCDLAPAEWPDWLCAQAKPPELPPVRDAAVVSDSKLIRSILAVPLGAAEGQRNCALYWAARRLAESTLAREAGTALLREAAQSIGLPPAEASSIIRSAFRARART